MELCDNKKIKTTKLTYVIIFAIFVLYVTEKVNSQDTTTEEVIPKEPSSRDVFNFIKKYPFVKEDKLAEHLLMYPDCQKLLGFISSIEQEELESIMNLAEYNNGRCFKKPTLAIEKNSEKEAFTALARKIDTSVSEVSKKIRKSLSRFSILKDIINKPEDLVENNKIAQVFLLSQAKMNSCLSKGLKRIYIISSKRRALLFSTLSQLTSGCKEDNGIFYDCDISRDDFSQVWKSWEEVSGCLLEFYNELALNLSQSFAIVSQYDKCRVEDNSNLEEIFVEIAVANNDGGGNLRYLQDDNVVSINLPPKYKFFTPRKTTSCANKVFPKFKSDDINPEKIKIENTIENYFNEKLKKETLKRSALEKYELTETCHQNRMYFNSNSKGKFIIPLKDSLMENIKSSINLFEIYFLNENNIKIDTLKFKSKMSEILDNESDYDLLCAELLEIIKPDFYNINRLIKLKENAISQTAANINSKENFWYHCEYNKTTKIFSCACQQGLCSYIYSGAVLNKISDNDLQMRLKDNESKWIINYETLTFSIWKTGSTLAYFGEYSVNYNHEGSNGSEIISNKKYEFYVNGEKTNTHICNQLNGCNKIGLSTGNSKKDKQSCFGMLKDKCRWDLNIELEDYLENLMQIGASQYMPYRNINTLGQDQLNFISGFYFDGFNLNYNFLLDAPNSIFLELNGENNADDINRNNINMEFESDIVPDGSVVNVVDGNGSGIISNEDNNSNNSNNSNSNANNDVSRINGGNSGNSGNSRRRVLLEFGNTFDTDPNAQIDPDTYLLITQENTGYEPVIEEGSVKGLGDVDFYITDYEDNTSFAINLSVIILMCILLIYY